MKRGILDLRRESTEPNSQKRQILEKYEDRELQKIIGLMACTMLICLVTTSASLSQKHSYLPPKGYVPDAKTAIAVAVAILSPIYGEEKIRSEYPLTATLSKDVWTVQGSMEKNMRGGVALIEISKKSGSILRVTHGK